MVQSDHQTSTVLIIQELKFARKTFWNNLKLTTYTKKLNVQVPKTTKPSWNDGKLLLYPNKIDPLLRRLVSGDSGKQRQLEMISKTRLLARIGVREGIILCSYSMSFSPKAKLTFQTYVAAIAPSEGRKHPAAPNFGGVEFYQHSATPQILMVKRQKLRELRREVLMHLIYSTELARSGKSFGW